MRVTSRRNPETGKYEVLRVTDGPDGVTEETTVDSEWETSPEANERVRELKGEELRSQDRTDYEAGDKESDLRRKQQRVGDAPKEGEKGYGGTAGVRATDHGRDTARGSGAGEKK